MATIEGRPRVELYVSIGLSESEAAALGAIASYGTDEFLKVFYEHLGSTYLKPHELGLRSLFKSIRNEDIGITSLLRRSKIARQAFTDSEK